MRLDERNFSRFQPEAEYIEIQSHVFFARGAGQREHPDIEREPEHHLRGRAAVLRGNASHFGVSNHRVVTGQERETLVDYAIRSAELANRPIPPADGVTPVLHEPRANTGILAQLPKLLKRDIAHAKQPRPAAGVNFFHRPPRFPVGRG